jgi:hypothetical protein
MNTETPIKTLEDAIRAAEIDTAVWFVERWECSQWTVPMKVERGQRVQELTSDKGKYETLAWNQSEAITTQQYRVKVFLRRIVRKEIHDSLKLVFADLKQHAPKWPKIDREKSGKAEPYLAVFGLFDVHFGKLCWAAETGSNYDLKIAETIFRNAVADLIAESSNRQIAKIVLPIGNDWLHIDNRDSKTTSGTPQDVDGRFSKVFAAAKLAALWAVEILAGVAPVQVEWVPGNHDRTLSECLCHVVDAYFHRSDRVEVNAAPTSRKYFHWGCNLLGFAHGDEIKPENLPNLMATENPSAWAGSTCREWLIGHMHRSRQWVTKPVDTHQGTTVRVLRSLAGTDAWHFSRGYVGASQACEVYWYGRDRGYAGHAVVNARAG